MPKEARKPRGTARAKKDPNAPKRSLTAFILYCNEHRATLRAENPGLSFGQYGKILGERWRSMNDDDKKPYVARAAQDKKRYEDEKAAYNA